VSEDEAYRRIYSDSIGALRRGEAELRAERRIVRQLVEHDW
jgi:hypothetical protein